MYALHGGYFPSSACLDQGPRQVDVVGPKDVCGTSFCHAPQFSLAFENRYSGRASGCGSAWPRDCGHFYDAAPLAIEDLIIGAPRSVADTAAAQLPPFRHCIPAFFHTVASELRRRRAASNLVLNCVPDIHQHLPKPCELLSSLAGICRNGTVRRHENISAQGINCIQCLQPVEPITVVNIQKLSGEK
jgi:hypothetical protein